LFSPIKIDPSSYEEEKEETVVKRKVRNNQMELSVVLVPVAAKIRKNAYSDIG
jgi:hypothetical protein